MDEHVIHPETAEAPATRRDTPLAPARTRRGGWLRWLLLAVLIGAGGVAWYQLRTPAPVPGKAATQAPPQPVGVATVARGDIRVVLDGLGAVSPLATVTVKTQIAGQLQQIAFEEGQMVRQGDFLAQIDPRPYQAALAQFQGQLAHDQALLRQSQVDLARYQTLLKQDSIARQQAEDQIYLVQQYQGQIIADQAQIDTQKLNIAYCHIVAPVTGRVGLRQVDEGNFVQTSDANGIVVLTQLQPISVVFTLPEDDLPLVLKHFRAGAKLPVVAYDRANQAQLATGVLGTIDNQVDTTTGTFKLRAMFDNTDEGLFPNQFVNARLLADTLHGVVTAPVAAIQRGAPGTFVYVVNADNTVSVRTVTLGPTDGDYAQVASGLAVGETVVVDGTDRLRDGARVSIPAAPAQHGQPPSPSKP